MGTKHIVLQATIVIGSLSLLGCEVPEIEVPSDTLSEEQLSNDEGETNKLPASNSTVRQPSSQPEHSNEKAVRIEFSHPTSFEELKEIYTKAFEAGDMHAIAQLIYDNGLSEKSKSVTLQALAEHAGKAGMLLLETHPEKTYDDYYRRKYNGDFSHGKILLIDYEGELVGVSFDWPVGEIEGKYYFAGYLYEDDAAN